MTSKRNNNYIHLYVCAPVVYVSIGKLQPGIQNLESASARNVLRWAREVKGVLSFLFSLLEAIHKRWLPSVVTELEHTFPVLPVKGLRRRNSICSPTQRGEFLK